jgi:heme exporter protein B
MIRAALALSRLDLIQALRSGGGFGLALTFFASVIAVAPFAVGPDLALLSRIGAALIWLAALLATLVGLDRLFAGDAEDGTLDLVTASPAPLAVLVLAKAAAHWLVTGLPLVVATPVLGLLLNMAPASLAASTVTLLVGTPALTLLGMIGAGLTVGLRRGGLLIPVLVLPLAVPVLIFGVAAAERVAEEGPTTPPLLVLAGLTLAAAVLAPLVVAASLRLSRG